MSLVCKICGYESENSLQAHLNHNHKMNNSEYRSLYPDAEIYSKKYSDRLIYTNAHRDPSYKQKISENTKKYLTDPEWVKNHSEALKRAQNKPEVKNKHSQGASKYYKSRNEKEALQHRQRSIESWKNPEIRERRLEAIRKADQSEDVRKKHSECLKRYLSDPVNLEKRRTTLKKAWAKPENREKLNRIIQMGLTAAMSEEGRENHRRANLRPDVRLKRSLNAKKNISNILKARKKYSKLNEFLESKLIEAGLGAQKEYSIGPYSVDFCFPEKSLVVEADGDWWHANPEFMKEKNLTELHPIQKKMIRLDKAKNTYLKNHSYKILRFWERDLYKKTDGCIKKIKETLEIR